MARLFVLGAGGPIPTTQRFGSSNVLQLGDEYIMFDCGPAATYRLARLGIDPLQIDYLFFTHHHFDHDVDYPCFMLSRWDVSIGGEKELQVFGPAPTREITERLIGEEGAFAFDWKARVNSPLSQQAHKLRGGTLPRKPPSVDAHDVAPGKVFSGGDWEVTAALADHVQPWLDSLAYRLDCSDGSIVFTGDTAPCDTVLELAKGADVMVAMCGGEQQLQIDNGTGYGQMGTTWAGQLAQDAGVKRLVLTHIGPRFSTHGPMEKGIAEVASVFDGEIIYAQEMMSTDLW